ncbi:MULTISPECIES: aspartate-semialdehyde dehydrogenase [unclassified Thermotoga]|uniref:aspartate-semialdehyde dehydrogenase n=1 Tax=unclassified Thermotoga TaxID=2631113 RepID=UPI0001600C30|nr:MULTISPECIES: aspartate-semialdehyde dehydrogenase [unclassified Thermotoga]ACB09761.1 aspartate-semialdehyde dehydrogenase [Thermotoga sp. RQ2]AIY88591.1 aspartate-semialdehyde dehydrogenase [Thermotoga sp. Cell2]KHC94191.1 aspartate-semialdehyde dehydrogenase [Thermotoga sp. TBGT1765]KHC94759.1 aspartate-semialdehyde dehydrogenase [Thermotoga sp. TBGT1766]KHC95368.1 aspartate-semialdehyde dehydrogenase [Thermotoga sp. Xyl54]
MKVGVVGATGEVGRTMVKVLEEFNVPVTELRLFASERSVGKEIEFKGEKFKVELLTEESMKWKCDYLLFSAGASVSRKFAPIAAENGVTVIDNSSAFRMEKEIPLVVPEVNAHLLKGYTGIIANPNCSTIQMILSIYKLHEVYGIEEIFVSTYQSVSGAGHKGIEELLAQERGENVMKVFPKPIHRNVIPLIGDIQENLFSQEEMKMVNETRKILNDYSIRVYPTTVRVPVLYGHSEAIMVRFKKPYESLEKVREVIASGEDVVVTDDLITPVDVAGKNETYVCRLRAADERSILFWNVADNIRVGAATNAVRILLKHAEMNGKV